MTSNEFIAYMKNTWIPKVQETTAETKTGFYVDDDMSAIYCLPICQDCFYPKFESLAQISIPDAYRKEYNPLSDDNGLGIRVFELYDTCECDDEE